MKILFIGGTGTISMAITRLLIEKNEDLYLINRGNHNQELTNKVHSLHADINDERKVKELIKDLSFDCVVDFIAYKKEDIERDYRLFKDKTKQYIFISSASAYQKSPKSLIVKEDTPLENPFWEYSRNKIACENLLHQYMKEGFPVTIVRPSHTYDERRIPTCIHGNNGSYQVLKRIIDGKAVIIHDDGQSLWTLTFNQDFAKGFIGLIGNKKAINETYHITSDESLTWNQIYQIIANCLNKELKVFYVPTKELAKSKIYDLEGNLLGDKANSMKFDNSKIKSISPDFICTTPFVKGAKIAIDNILANPEYQKEDPEFDAWCDEIISSGIIS